MIEEVKTQASGISNQIIIYAKHWYKNTDSYIDDIRYLISKVAWLDIECVSERDVKQMIISTFLEYVPKVDLEDALLRGLGVINFFPNDTPEDPFRCMLGKLAVIKGEYVNMGEKLDVNFSEKDK